MQRFRLSNNPDGRPSGTPNRRSASKEDRIRLNRVKHNGKRGRPPGSRNIDAMISRKKMADKLGLLPHEFLALVASGQTITVRRFNGEKWINETWDPSPGQQIDAAVAAAPYFQPKLASHRIDHGPIMMQLDQSKLGQLSDQMLAALELLVNSLATTGSLPAIEAPKIIDQEDYDEVFQ